MQEGNGKPEYHDFKKILRELIIWYATNGTEFENLTLFPKKS